MTFSKFFRKKTLLATAVIASSCALSLSVIAAENPNDTLLPALPAPLQNLVNDGAQIRFLGKDYGVEGWVAIKNGQEQYFYVLPETGAFLTGLLFEPTGQAVTLNQVNRLRAQSGELLDNLAEDTNEQAAKQKAQAEKYEFKTPSEQLFWDIEHSNWVPIGKAGAPVFYSFVDPQCPHCHSMMELMRPDIEAGRVQVRIIPVGFKDETRAQAAYLLATPGADKVWWAHMDGDTTALPAKKELNDQGVQRNLAIMQSWKLSVTPLIVYRGKDGQVKIIRGKPKDKEQLINDIGART